MNSTKISWTNKTWNPVTGCTKYSAGCANCYAEVMTHRFKKAFPNGFNITLHPERFSEPLKVDKPTMFFVCSMADLFHKDVPFDYVDKLMTIMESCPRHTFQILTKRVERMSAYFAMYRDNDVPKNVWLGATVESADYKRRIYDLAAKENASVRFLSCEPLLSDLGTLDLSGIDWVIVGGETGPKARPMKKDWVLNIQRQCKEQNVPFFFKSWGRYDEHGKPCPKDQHDLLDGVKYQVYPRGLEKAAKKFVEKNSPYTDEFMLDNEVEEAYKIAELTFKRGAQWQKEQTIKKACEWLQKHMNDYLVHGRDIDFLYDDFRKAMGKEDEPNIVNIEPPSFEESQGEFNSYNVALNG